MTGLRRAAVTCGRWTEQAFTETWEGLRRMQAPIHFVLVGAAFLLWIRGITIGNVWLENAPTAYCAAWLIAFVLV